MVNGLGEVLREMRTDVPELLLNMASKLEVSSAFLSAIEHGKKKPPADFLQRLDNSYEISSSLKRRLRTEIDRSNSGVQVKAKSALARETAAVFARKINDLPDKNLKEIQSLLLGKRSELDE